jgi:Txe/YoeB family toxin of toxin-antitoxin system
LARGVLGEGRSGLGWKGVVLGIKIPKKLIYVQGWWSRRITGEHRLVYRVSGKDEKQQLDIVQCRYHY